MKNLEEEIWLQTKINGVEEKIKKLMWDRDMLVNLRQIVWDTWDKEAQESKD
jgi:hypothetical protein